ncbi:MAG: sodium-dependent transporter [Pseudomonadales bacterium]|jgi:NSS family neurotransmitter:Na+ symporter|nr:sodium-dependent transporter [Gammaproteobacteria bacterium]MCH1596969.1 sodium-dependent transporter [Pseudomonadales bacterium]RPG28548.1 MAG: sodium-dependent transporter [Gammaproteobacteria bacterium TMED243]|tara:strand:+ start:1151 stop:2533 length:1383 start_codon:yes stop_codon:yes gene_type:complete
MTTSTSVSSQRWSSRWLFVLAAAGSAVGLGNIWKFPYIAGENGGGAFVLIYLVCIAAVGIPIMVSEVLLGRQGRSSPIHTMRKLAKASGRSQRWSVLGWMGVLAGFLILSYYAVIAGWAVNYVWLSGSGAFEGASAQAVGQSFDDFLASPFELIAYQTAFMILTIWIVGRGVTQGLEAAIRWFMPLLFLLLIALLVYSFNSGGFDQGFAFMFDMKWDAVTADSWLIAMGQAFFTLSLGMGTMMAYGAYVPDDANLGTTVVTIAALDTLIAVAAGLAIFPIVFANGLEVAQGPGLTFVTLPLAFGQMPFGSIFGALFFLLLSFAAITSAISLTEPALSFLVEEYNAKRQRVAISLGVICWALGLGTVFSFNVWSDVTFVGGLTFFDSVDYFSQNILLPLGGMLITFFAIWLLPRGMVEQQLGIENPILGWAWKVVAGIVAPLGVLAVFLSTIWPMLSGLWQ